MDSVDLILKYFPELSPVQKQQLSRLGGLYAEWNAKINVISRKDMEHFYERHVLHSLAISKFITFKDGDLVMDIGTGGGFPGIPLAILFPGTFFTLVDSIGKKIKVVESIAGDLGLTNVKAINARAESLEVKVDYVVSRATAPLMDLVKWSVQNIIKQQGRGLIALKGGDLEAELSPVGRAEVVSVQQYFEEPFFETKRLVFLPVK